jgi:diguanylate cyclase (GGDEF)-like protein
MPGKGAPLISSTDRQPRRLSRQLSRLSLLVLLGVALIAVLGLYWSTRQSDEVSVERQVRVARHSINVALDELALQQETVAVWDESASYLTRPVLERQWLFDNMGSWLHRIFRHDETFLLDGRSRPVQAVTEGRVAPLSRYTALEADLAPLIDSVRGRNPGARSPHDRSAGLPLHPQATVRTTDRATHSTRLALVGGRPAAVSAMLVKPSTPNYVRPNPKWPILISVRYLDGSFLQELESRHLIEGARFARSPKRLGAEHALLLETAAGKPLGFLIWQPELPGSRILETLLPSGISALSVLAVLMLLLTRSLRQTLDERAAFEARAAHLAYHDSLTGLPNRALLSERLQQAIGDLKRGSSLSLLLIDLDRFKQVNDSLGHLAGDQLIREFAVRLQRLVRPADTVARLGGDEFAVVLRDGWSASQVDDLCAGIVALFEVPFTLADTAVFGGASIGAVHVDGSVSDTTELMRRADVALYEAKGAGRGCARVYKARMDESGQARTKLEGELREALREEQFAAWFQPQVDRERNIIGRELLLRWPHPTLGCVGPQDIIPLAEETGLIAGLGDWMLRQAAQLSTSSAGLFTAVNLSPIQLNDSSFAPRLIDIFAEAGADPRLLELEVTEQVMLDDGGRATGNLRRLRDCGFRIALDDFGTGYSSLSYLRRLAVDKIKIDRSFVADVQHSKDARAIVAAIVTLGRAIGLAVSAEGVETESQAELLLAAGCDQLQGFLFGEPQPLAGYGTKRQIG